MDEPSKGIRWGDLAFWLGMGGLLVAFLILRQRRSVGEEDAYKADLARYRAEKDRYLREDSASPYRHRASFQGLAYYPVQPGWRFDLTLLPAADTGAIWLPTTAGTQVAFKAAGWVQLPKLGRGVVPLLVLRTLGPDLRLFIAFSDETSEDETFEHGRYVDVDLLNPHRIHLDMNMAYHPPCAYRAAAACPLPPEMNRLSFPVPVGEKLPED